MNRNELLLDRLVHFWIQVDEISDAFRRAVDKRLGVIAQRINSSLRSSSGQITHRNLPNLASNALLSELNGLVQDVNESLLETILRASRAIPRFMNQTQVQSEALDLSLIDPFGLTDLGADNNTFTIVAEVLGITEDEARELFATLLLFGLGLSDVWQIFLLRQRDRLRQRLAQVISELPDESQTIPPNVLRQVERTISETLQGNNPTNSPSYTLNGITSSVLFSTINKILQATVQKNQEIFTGEYLWVGILDSAICKRCASLHNKRFMFPNGPLPQLHPWCRCFVMPIIRGHGPVSAGNFNDWLKSQSSKTQDRILGKRNAELFRQGRVKFKDFVQFKNRVLPRERTTDQIERIANR